jgi:CP family cyanate transporter-like MFS transporter
MAARGRGHPATAPARFASVNAQRPARPPLSPALLAAGVILVSINLRPAAASIGPVLDRIQSDTGLSSGWAGALATLPVLCFGLLAPLAPLLARRLGLHTAIAVAMIALASGMLVRLVGGPVLLFAGTALAGAAIATGNVLLPVIVRRDFPDRTGTAMAVYTTSLIGFAALAAGVTVPIANALGGGWRPGLGIWALPAAIAAVAWLPAFLRRNAGGADGWRVDAEADTDMSAGADAPRIRALLRQPLAWQVTLYFALQSGGFYSTLAWLPDIFRSHGAGDSQAGFLLSLSILVGLLTSTTIPGLATRVRDQRWLVAVSAGVWAAGLIGILAAPMSAPYLWVVLLGLGQNSTFPLALMLIVLRGGGLASTEGLSTMAQSVGYVLAAIFPLAVGALHGASGSWAPALILLLALLVPQLAFGLAAGRDRTLAAV